MEKKILYIIRLETQKRIISCYGTRAQADEKAKAEALPGEEIKIL